MIASIFNGSIFNQICQVAFLIGFIWMLIINTKADAKGRKARCILKDIEKLVAKASKTEDKKEKEEILKEIFEKLDIKL